MKSRPYFNKSIKELEKTFNDNRSESETLNRLIHELEFRSTQRALALKKQVQAANTGHSPNSASQKPEPTANQIGSAPREPVLPNGEHPKPHEPIIQPETIKVTAKPVPKPPIKNDAQDILRAWTALEVLSPQGYQRETDLVAGDRKKIARFEERALPWELGEKSLPKKRLYYELILGAIELAPAVDTLLKVYADKRPDKPSIRGDSPIASILLDKEGRPLEEETSAAISSFAWGVPIALQGDLKKLANWSAQEKVLKGQFRKLLVKRDRNDDVIPLTKNHISELFNYLVTALNLHDHAIKAPYFALRRYEFFANKTPPEPGLLNSFFLEDLETARVLANSGTLPNALEHYLGIKKPSQRIDLLEDNAGLRDLLQPRLTPPGKWPGKGRFPLALLQQGAVNATNEQQLKTGVLGVNGPPGTGKTTLLRDVVAARLIERAVVMNEFSRPSQAFISTSQILQRSGAKITLHKLDERLKGFEMVVTSSNNKAVENVSAELPALDAIASDAPELRYFKSISDNVLERDTWGVVAAVLGNSSNRYMFSQRFWRDEENGLSTYLNHACGVPQIVSETQDGGRPPLKRNRHVIDREHPPLNSRDAQTRWDRARSQFKTRFDALKRTENCLQKLHAQFVRHAQVAAEVINLTQELPSLEEEAHNIEGDHATALHEQQEAETRLRNSQQAQSSHFASRPGFFARLFRTAQFRTWRDEEQGLLNKTAGDQQLFLNCRKMADDLGGKLAAKKESIGQKRKSLETLFAEKADLEASMQQACKELDAPIPDDDFFAGAHEDIQTASVWFDKAASRQRDDVFEAAIQLHRAFIDAAADPLRQNLSVFVETFGTRSLGTPQKDELIADLWSSFFLVVPVVSTTFASVNRMFSRLPTEALGWLLVDEAGQAPPQAAVGAMLRTKRSVVVGDPLQIEPVVTLPNSLTEEVCSFFGIDPLKYNAPEGSVQTVSDAASMYCAKFPIGSGYRDVGSPLLVHRRCDSPMFDISNEIAYSNLMVQAKNQSKSNPVLGHSCWIDVVGKPGPDKWCADEGEVLVEMLRKLRSGDALADLYVVTPFVIVQDNLRQVILSSGVLSGWVDKPDAWVREHVGTVHTVQGREAEIVFFVLGAQASSQNGARNWAGSRPNLVNVAVTRAKTSLYVIGNRSLWRAAGVFSVLDRYLSH